MDIFPHSTFSIVMHYRLMNLFSSTFHNIITIFLVSAKIVLDLASEAPSSWLYCVILEVHPSFLVLEPAISP